MTERPDDMTSSDPDKNPLMGDTPGLLPIPGMEDSPTKVETVYLLTTTENDQYAVIAESELQAIEQLKDALPDDFITNVEVHSRRRVWDIPRMGDTDVL